MMKNKLCILLIIMFVLSLTGCSQQEPKVTPTLTPTSTPVASTSTPSAPTPTPSSTFHVEVIHGGHCSPVVPINLYFTKGYNIRDASKVAEAFNSTVMSNYSIEDVRKELEFAEEHEIFLIGIESGSVNDVPRGETEVLLDVSGERVRTSINFSLRCIDRVENKPDVDWADKVVHHELKITEWPFGDIRKAVKDISAPTLIPPNTSEQEVVEEFFNHYNHRNGTGVYSLFSEKVRNDYTLREVNRTLESAENTVLNVNCSRTERNNEIMVVANASFIETEGISPEDFNGTNHLLLNLSFDYKETHPRIDSWVLDKLSG
ncbi:MAG: hypothetical protein R6U44_07045 [Archaeoglobaceae archaeon]